MNESFIITAQDGRITKYVELDSSKNKVFTKKIKDAQRFKTYPEAVEILKVWIPEIDLFGEALGNDLIKDDTVYGIEKIFEQDI